MRRLTLAAIILFLAGCATTGYPPPGGTAGFVRLDEFCKKHNLDYSFDTIDDIVRIYSSDMETRLLLNSPVGYFNGSVFYMQGQPFYMEGKILVPADIEKAMFARAAWAVRLPFVIKTVVLDAGHGGHDPGATSPWGTREKDINLRIVKLLETELTKRGYRVILTRGSDKYLTLEERVDVAWRYKADLFVSIHANSGRSRALSGTEIYFLSSFKLDSAGRALSLARSGSYWPGDADYNVKAILWDLTLTKNYFLSVEAAQVFYHTFRDLSFKVKPPKSANLHVLRNAYTPALLVETGYLTNRAEEGLLRKPRYQQQVAEVVAEAVVALNRRHNVETAQKGRDDEQR